MSMPRFAAILASIAMCTGASAVVASPASATIFTLTLTECKGGKYINLCWDNGGVFDVLEGEQSLEVGKKKGSAELQISATISGQTLVIGCEGIDDGTLIAMEILQHLPFFTSDAYHLVLLFLQCGLRLPIAIAEDCKVPASKETMPLLGEPKSATELKIVPEAGERHPLFELTFENNGAKACPSVLTSAPYPITGFQSMDVINPGTPETSKGGSLVEKSGLRSGTGEATMTAELTLSFPGLEDQVIVSETA